MRTLTIAVCLGSLCAASPQASARAKRHPHVLRAPAPISADAVALGFLAPPSSPSTFAQTYGDAGFARAHLRAQYPREAEIDAETAANVGTPYPCDPRAARADAYVCRNDPRVTGYGQFYAYTPSYVSAPQNVGVDPSVQAPILPPATAVFWAVNGLRYDPHN